MNVSLGFMPIPQTELLGIIAHALAPSRVFEESISPNPEIDKIINNLKNEKIISSTCRLNLKISCTLYDEKFIRDKIAHITSSTLSLHTRTFVLVDILDEIKNAGLRIGAFIRSTHIVG